jgi:chromosome segregation ATPase
MNSTGTPPLADVQEETELAGKKDLKQLTAAIQELWVKARRVSEMLLRVRAEHARMKQKLSEVEQSERETKSRLEQRELELSRVRNEFLQLQSNGSSIYSKEEKEAIKAKIKEMISRINSRL